MRFARPTSVIPARGVGEGDGAEVGGEVHGPAARCRRRTRVPPSWAEGDGLADHLWRWPRPFDPVGLVVPGLASASKSVTPRSWPAGRAPPHRVPAGPAAGPGIPDGPARDAGRRTRGSPRGRPSRRSARRATMAPWRTSPAPRVSSDPDVPVARRSPRSRPGPARRRAGAVGAGREGRAVAQDGVEASPAGLRSRRTRQPCRPRRAGLETGLPRSAVEEDGDAAAPRRKATSRHSGRWCPSTRTACDPVEDVVVQRQVVRSRPRALRDTTARSPVDSVTRTVDSGGS